MANAILGRAGGAVLIDLDVCVKTGQTTDQRATLRGRTTPAWVTVLLLFSVVGFLIADSVTSRRYRVTLPFTHAVHDRWRRTRRLVWLVGLVGVIALVSAAVVADHYTLLLLGGGIALLVGSAVAHVVNARKNHVCIRMTRDGDLVLAWAHPAFAAAVRDASVEELSSRR